MPSSEQLTELIDAVFPAKRLITREELDLMWEGTRKLKGRYVTLFQHRFGATPQPTYKQIGQTLGISQGYARQLTVQMLKWLKLYVKRKGTNMYVLPHAEPKANRPSQAA